MKLKNIVFTNGFVQSYQKLLDKELPISLSYNIAKSVKDINEKSKLFEELKIKLYKKYGDEKDGQIKIKDNNLLKFQNELDELLNIEEEYNIEKIEFKIDSLIELSAKDILLLEDVISIK